MKIRGRVVIKGEPVADAEICTWLVKRSDGAEVLAFDGRSVDNGTFGVSQDVLDGLACNSRHFIDVKYSVEKKGYRTIRKTRPILEEGEINLGDIELVREALRVRGRISSNGRAVEAARMIVCIDDVERAHILTAIDGTIDQDIEGNYEGRKLVWTVKRFGYIREAGSIPDIRAQEVNLGEIHVVPRWWTGLAQTFGIDPRIVLGAFLVALVGLLVWIWWGLRCPDVSVKASNFIKHGVTMQDVETHFGECVFFSQGACGAAKDSEIIACMTAPTRGYQYQR